MQTFGWSAVVVLALLSSAPARGQTPPSQPASRPAGPALSPASATARSAEPPVGDPTAAAAVPALPGQTLEAVRASGGAEKKRWWRIDPQLVIIGALSYEMVGHQQGVRGDQPIEDQREDRFVTLALSRFGVSGEAGQHVYLKSEFEASFGRHGTSVWEGQAAFQIREQLLGLRWWRLGLTAGRILDPASVNYTSAHVADLLLQDPFTHSPLLEAGYNLGYGVLASLEALPGLRLGLTFNAANPSSMTSSFLVHGKFSSGLYTRLHHFSSSRIADSADKSPTPNLHMMMLTPSLVFRRSIFEAHAAGQLFWVNIDTNVPSNDPELEQSDDLIFGLNLRGGLRLHLLGEMLQPFANVSYLDHQMLDYLEHPLWVWPENNWRVLTFSGGLDFNYSARGGVGAQYSFVHSKQGDGSLVHSAQHYLNVGTSYWITDHVAAALRFALWSQDKIDLVEKALVPEDVEEQEYSLYLTLRVQL